MPLRVSFAEQATGIVTTTAGERALGLATFERFDGMTEVMAAVRSYLETHPDHEAWVGRLWLVHVDDPDDPKTILKS